MRNIFFLGMAALFLAACSDTPVPDKQPVQQLAQSPANGDLQLAIRNYQRVAARVEPVAEQICRRYHADKKPQFCDFRMAINHDAKQPANAFQSIGDDGRPVITFNTNMLLKLRNDDELAFVMGHEAGHQIASHLAKSRNNQALGGAIIGLIVGISGGNAQVGVDLGAQIGGLAYSKQFELQADTLAVHIADRAGYNAGRGAQELARTGGSSSWLSTHPSSSQRVANAQNVVAQIRTAKRNGQTAPILW